MSDLFYVETFALQDVSEECMLREDHEWEPHIKYFRPEESMN
jgi:hypothetical protein